MLFTKCVAEKTCSCSCFTFLSLSLFLKYDHTYLGNTIHRVHQHTKSSGCLVIESYLIFINSDKFRYTLTVQESRISQTTSGRSFWTSFWTSFPFRWRKNSRKTLISQIFQIGYWIWRVFFKERLYIIYVSSSYYHLYNCT